MNGMQQEIDQLRYNYAELKKSMAFDEELFDDLDDFDKKVSETPAGVLKLRNLKMKFSR